MRFMIGSEKAVTKNASSGGRLEYSVASRSDYLSIGSETPGSWDTTSGEGDQVGSSSDYFGDMYAIGHWVLPGWEDYSVGDLVTVELLADHALGIASVHFYANGGSGLTVTQRNSSGHFQCSFVMPAGEVELRAVITPQTRGRKKVMQGNRTPDSAWGNDAVWVYGDPTRSFVCYGNRTVNTVSVSDLSEMLSAISSASGPTRIEAASGTYNLAGENSSGYNTTNGWVTVTPASGANVTITSTATSSYSTKLARLLRFDGIDFYLTAGDTEGLDSDEYVTTVWPSAISNSDIKLWCSNCNFTGDINFDSSGIPTQTFGASPFFRNVAHLWVSGSTCDKLGSGSPVRGSQLTYKMMSDIVIQNAVEDVFSHASALTNCTINNLNGLGTNFHTDTYQFQVNSAAQDRTFGHIIINKLDAWQPQDGGGQGIFNDGSMGQGVDGMVVRDCQVANPQGAVKLSFGKAGNPDPIKNIAFIDCVIDPQGSRWFNDTDPEDEKVDASNNGSCVFRNCISTTDRNSGSWASSPFLPGQGVDPYRTSPKRAYAIDTLDGDVSAGSPYWSPYNVHLVGPDGVFASSQSNGQNDGATGIFAEYNTGTDIYRGTWLTTDTPASDYNMDYAWDVPTTAAAYITYGITAVGLQKDENRIAFTFISTTARTFWQNQNTGTILLDTTDPNISAFEVPSLTNNVGTTTARNLPTGGDQQLIASWIATLVDGYTIKITPPE